MGNASSMWTMWPYDEEVVDPNKGIPKFDPMIGFPNGRKERTVNATPEEMESAAIPPEMRDYCVDLYLKFLSCRADNYPLIYKCKHIVHQYKECQYEDYIMRMKEREREKRLEKLAAKQAKEEMVE